MSSSTTKRRRRTKPQSSTSNVIKSGVSETVNKGREDKSYISSSSPEKTCRIFSLLEIQKATDYFSDERIVGSGGFGKVYRGFLSENTTNVVAVKRLKSESKQGAKEFRTEIEFLSKFRHCHLVSLIGYCDEFPEMILVYEFMPNGTLADHLYKISNSSLPWEKRLKICIGAARGLDYLHTGTGVCSRVIHRDVKSANILLDENWAAKISDLGLSKTGPANLPCSEVLTDLIKGTRGYIDPDYVKTRKLTRKADVYSFGVVLLEVLCGRRAWNGGVGLEHQSLAPWAQQYIKKGSVNEILDPSVKWQISPSCLQTFADIASSCLHDRPNKRPTMVEVVAMLEFALVAQEGSIPSSTIDDQDLLNHFNAVNETLLETTTKNEESLKKEEKEVKNEESSTTEEESSTTDEESNTFFNIAVDVCAYLIKKL